MTRLLLAMIAGGRLRPGARGAAAGRPLLARSLSSVGREPRTDDLANKGRRGWDVLVRRAPPGTCMEGFLEGDKAANIENRMQRLVDAVFIASKGVAFWLFRRGRAGSSGRRTRRRRLGPISKLLSTAQLRMPRPGRWDFNTTQLVRTTAVIHLQRCGLVETMAQACVRPWTGSRGSPDVRALKNGPWDGPYFLFYFSLFSSARSLVRSFGLSSFCLGVLFCLFVCGYCLSALHFAHTDWTHSKGRAMVLPIRSLRPISIEAPSGSGGGAAAAASAAVSSAVAFWPPVLFGGRVTRAHRRQTDPPRAGRPVRAARDWSRIHNPIDSHTSHADVPLSAHTAHNVHKHRHL